MTGKRMHMTEKNKQIKKAAALQYDAETSEAPVLKAKGNGVAARHIINIAQEHNIPIHKDPSLVEVLTKIDLEQQIPPELYAVVAEILAMVYQLEKQAEDHE